MVLFALLPMAFALAIGTNKKFEETIALSIYIITTILYFSGLVASFKPGLIFIVGIVIVSVIYCAFRCFKNPDIIRDHLITYGFVGFMILVCYFFVFSFGRYFKYEDDFIHWGIAVKHFYLLSDFSDVPFSSDLASHYPPIVPIWCFFTTKLWPRCSTGMMFWGEQIFISSVFAQVFELAEKRKSKSGIVLCAFFALALPYWSGPLNQNTYQNTYALLVPEILMAVMFFNILFNFEKYLCTSQSFNIYLSIFGLFILTLVKQTGLVTSFIACFIMLSVNIKRQISIRKNMQITGIGFAVVVFAYLTWNMHTSRSVGRFDVFGTFLFRRTDLYAKSLAIFLLLSVSLTLFLLLDEKRREIVLNGYKRLRQYVPTIVVIMWVILGAGLTMVKGIGAVSVSEFCVDATAFYFDMSYWYQGYIIRLPFYLFLFGLILIIRYFYKDPSRKDEVVFDIWKYLIIGLLMYCLFRTVSYMIYQYSSNKYELASLDRYIFEYMGAVLLFAFFMVYRLKSDGKLELCVVATILLFSNCSMMVSQIFDRYEKQNFPGIENVEFSYGDRVFYMDTKFDDNRCELDFYYQIAPAMMNRDELYVATWYENNDLSGRRLSVKEVEKRIASYDYVYIKSIDEGFVECYSNLFENPEDISDEHLYKTVITGGKVLLSLYK